MAIDIEKSFAEFLIDRGHLSPEKFVEAAHGVIESSKPVHSCVSPDEMVEIIRVQAEQGVGFKTACQSLDLWTDEKEAALRAVLRRESKSFVSELVVVGAIAVNDITGLLDEYLGYIYEEAV